MINYPVKILLLLIEAIKDNNPDGKFIKWLLENYPELGAFVNSIKGDDVALKWLGSHNYIEFVAIHDAIFEENGLAFQWLKDNTYYSALLISAIRGDNNASKWLKYNCEILYMMSEVIRAYKENLEKEENTTHTFFKSIYNPFKV